MGSNGKCFACLHWTLQVKDQSGDYKPHGMAKFKMGYCAKGDTWRYFGGMHDCSNGKFEAVEQQIGHKRLEWLEGKERF